MLWRARHSIKTKTTRYSYVGTLACLVSRTGRRRLPSRSLATLRVGCLIPNPLVSTGDGPPVRLDTILAGQATVLTAREPEAALADFCARHHLLLVRVSGPHEAGDLGQPSAGTRAGWAGIRLACAQRCAALQALIDDPALTVIVRPDRVIAAADSKPPVPRLPWQVPAATQLPNGEACPDLA